MKNLLHILSKTELMKGDNTKKVLDKAIHKAFQEAEREEAETLIVLAHKYNLPCLDELLSELDFIPELPW